MKRQANPTLIGAFIIAAVGLLFATIIALGGTRLFEETQTYVLYFDDSVGGLEVGAQVSFQGVVIGYVSEMTVVVDKRKANIFVPVLIDIRPTMVKEINTEHTDRLFLERLIEHGLRAQLQVRSLVTGQLGIELDFFPDVPIHLFENTTSYKQIPTAPSAASVLADIMKDAQALMKNLTEVVGSDEVARIIKTLDVALVDAKHLIRNVDNHVEPVAVNLKNGLNELSHTLRTVHGAADYHTRHPEAIIQGKVEQKGRRE